MPHHVYTTRGVILNLHPTREVDKTVTVLTKDIGLVHASARGVRKLGSKLSGALLHLALAKVSLVRGKNAWRITTVSLLRDPGVELRQRREALQALARVSHLMCRLVRGEEKNPELFDEFEQTVTTLLDEKDTEIDTWEVYTVAHILAKLGYLSPKDLALSKKELIKAINNGLEESGLS